MSTDTTDILDVLDEVETPEVEIPELDTEAPEVDLAALEADMDSEFEAEVEEAAKAVAKGSGKSGGSKRSSRRANLLNPRKPEDGGPLHATVVVKWSIGQSDAVNALAFHALTTEGFETSDLSPAAIADHVRDGLRSGGTRGIAELPGKEAEVKKVLTWARKQVRTVWTAKG